MRVVLDTNVVVSALMNAFGPPGRILDLALAGEFEVAHDNRMMAEWRDVLHREKFAFPKRDVETFLTFIETEGSPTSPPPLDVKLPDPDDAPFLETAHASDSVLVSGNLKHYPPDERRGVVVMSPAEFLEAWISAQN